MLPEAERPGDGAGRLAAVRALAADCDAAAARIKAGERSGCCGGARHVAVYGMWRCAASRPVMRRILPAVSACLAGREAVAATLVRMTCA